MNDESLQFLNRKLTAQYGEDTAKAIFDGFYARRRTTLRVNTLKTSAEPVKAALSAAGIPWEQQPWFASALLLSAGAEKAVAALPLYERGEVYLQSLSSMLPPLFLDVRAGETVLDMAAAPGGKTCQMAAMSENKAIITACEKNAARAERLKFNLARQGATRVSVLTADAATLSDFFAFDKILLDAPCSGSGTVDLNAPSGKADFNARFLQKLTAVQTALLKKALRLLKRGKTMVYSTCSLFREENEGVLRAAMAGANAEIVPIDGEKITGARFLPTEIGGTLCVLPDENFEGFFLAKIKKN